MTEERERFPRRTGVATLVARRRLTPRMIRVTLRHEGFGADWPLQQPGEILTLLFLPPDETVVLPLQGWVFPDDAPEQEWRNYTVRRHRPDRCELDVDVVMHEPRGPACTWACDAEVGADVGFAGPRVDYCPREDAAWLLLCGDETALPAIAAIVESRPAPERVLAVLEVHDEAEAPAFDVDGHAVDVRWIPRDGAPAATTPHLVDALRALELPAGDGHVWGAAESRVARDVRSVLRDERGLEKRRVSAKGYWLRTGDWILDDDAF